MKWGRWTAKAKWPNGAWVSVGPIWTERGATKASEQLHGFFPESGSPDVFVYQR